MKRVTFTAFSSDCIKKLEIEGRYSTAHLYRNALRSYTEYLNQQVVRFSDIGRDNLKRYELWLIEAGKLPNTISTYMRMLRSIYNKGVDAGHAKYIHRMFREVYTGIDTNHKKALPRKKLRTLLYDDPGTDVLRKTQSTARLIYQLCGMPFVDFAHISRSNISGGTLEYHRQKTGTKVSVKLLKPAVDTIQHLARRTSFIDKNRGGYLFDILSGSHGFRSREGYIEYQSALRRFNQHLQNLGRKLGLEGTVSSYTLRHSWATTAKYTGAPIEMISESLGHKYIKTTQIYLAGFNVSELAKVNKKVCSYIENVK